MFSFWKGRYWNVNDWISPQLSRMFVRYVHRKSPHAGHLVECSLYLDPLPIWLRCKSDRHPDLRCRSWENTCRSITGTTPFSPPY